MALAAPSKITIALLWALKILVALAFLAAATFKLIGAPMMVAEFGVVGLGQGFRFVVALIEVAGAVLLLTPKTARYGALTLLAVCAGALVAQLVRIHGDVVHVFVLAALTGLLAWAAAPAPLKAA
jgi:uncharacterized membrane protein YphA (DoxX/SURF4 family)